jgi:hypothetical protein
MRIKLPFTTEGAFLFRNAFDNRAIFTYRFLEWMKTYIGEENVDWFWEYAYYNQRSMRGAGGNKGGWTKTPYAVILSIHGDRSIILFRMRWGGELLLKQDISTE